MVIVYVFPIFLAYGIAYGSPFYYYPMTIAAMMALSCVASSISAFLVMAAVMIIPANRMKTIFVFFGLFLFLILYIAFRLLKPELLVDPDVFVNTLLYIKDLQTPSSPFLPSTWAFDTVRGALKGMLPNAFLNLAILASFAAALFMFVSYASGHLYFKGFSRTQTGAVRIFKGFSKIDSSLKFLPGPIRAFTLKEIKVFFRDHTQWSQLFLIAGLVIIYIYNFKVLPIDRSPIRTFYLQNLLSFLNMGLALFVLTAVTARFAYPAVSLEGDAWWIVRSAPIRLRHFLWIKFFIYLVGEFDNDLTMTITEELLKWDGCDAVIILGIMGRSILLDRMLSSTKKADSAYTTDFLDSVQGMLDKFVEEYVVSLIKMMETYEKPVFGVHLLTEGDKTVYSEKDSRFNAVFYKTPERAIKAFSKMDEYNRYITRK